MEVSGSEGGEKKKPPEGGENKTKRKMKTASQLEILEKTYAAEAYPSESLRAELSVKLGLSDRQLQMWFCHRRLKDKKATPVKRLGGQDSSPARRGGEEMAVGDLGNEHASGSGSRHSPFRHVAEPRRGAPRHRVGGSRTGGGEMPVMAMRYYESQQTIAELRAIAFVEAQLGEPLREDGPILGMDFDTLPPDAFGAPIATVGQKQSRRPYDAKVYERSDVKSIKGTGRALLEYQFIPEKPTVKTEAYERLAPSYHYGSPAEGPSTRTSLLSAGHPYAPSNEHLSSGYGFQDAYFGTHPISQLENPYIASERRATIEEDALRNDRRRKSEEARVAREVEAHERRIRKELEKQDILRRKREEQTRKELERQDRERRKEEERLLREKQREEERYQREQRRELERREKFLQKESLRAEKMKQREELRREREAARLKAANERAMARKIAKESMELIDDERLELMELAASCKGLPSIVSLDYETLQNLELYKDMRIAFPPKSVHLKKPFAVQPWTDSEDNIGNLLMVWRFLITFADVLGLWPFTLDEFVQAFHDYDPRLLSEIHVSLLKSIIKDIEDVARTPSMGLGANQTTAAHPVGGHPLIVEGAYAWGFDIRSWQNHLNPLTWPEILRQFALSAGFGPQLKKRNAESSYHRDNYEGNDGADIVSNLRSGAAVENAFAKMQERGFSNPRKSRHRLTPGTVKFAAFHVLSLEGDKGLTILEVADRIQKSGLRDLTTSKTPEASIAAALSRDTKLFERTAPSTYCVRAAYRKDPADAEAILSSARERIRVFKNGFLDGEDADEGERDEDSESDGGEDPEIDDLGTEINPEKEALVSQEVNKLNEVSVSGNGEEIVQVIETPKKDLQNSCGDSVHSESCVKMEDGASFLTQPVNVVASNNDVPNFGGEDPDIDESNPGEPWVQGLVEGEYSDLSVEERLNALVALVGVAIEGNSVRLVLEERLEAANALKKQMWAEVQLDKRRIKEDYVLRMPYTSFIGNKFELNSAISSAEAKQSPLVNVDDKNNETTGVLSVRGEQMGDPSNNNPCVSGFLSEGNLQMQEVCAGPDNNLFQQPGYAADRSRSQLKSYIGHKAEEMYVYRSLPLGQDRTRNRYWQFITSASQNDPGCSRIFVELHDGRWRLIDSEEGFDALLASLDVRGVRESQLHAMLLRIELFFKKAVRKKMLHANMGRQSEDTAKTAAVPSDCSNGFDSPSSTLCLAESDLSESSTSFVIELGRNKNEKNGAFQRYQDLERWIWKECLSSSALYAIKHGKKRCKQLLDVCDACHGVYSSENNHCPSCHRTFISSESGTSFSEHVTRCEDKLNLDQYCTLNGSPSFPLRIRLLKVVLALIEVSVPPEALQSLWTDSHRKSWSTKLNASSSAEDLLQVHTLLESAIKREHLFSEFETTYELLDSLNPRRCVAPNSTCFETITVLPWVPLTTAAVALRIMEFDAAIFYIMQQKLDSQKDRGSGNVILSAKYAFMQNPLDDGITRTPCQADNLKKDSWVDLGVGLENSGHKKGSRGNGSGNGRGRGRSHVTTTRTRGGRSQKRATGSRGESAKRNDRALGQELKLRWKGSQRGRGCKRGRRTVRSRQKPAKRMFGTGAGENIPEESIDEKFPRSLVQDWNTEDTTGLQLEDAEPASSSSERSEYEEGNGQGSGDEFDEMGMDDYATGFNDRAGDLDGSDYNGDEVDEDEDDNDEDDDQDEYDVRQDEQGDFNVDRFINGDSDEEENREEGGQDMEIDQQTGSTSSDYSD
ncbi:homeobox-DDT domain protein RLT2 isoform X2 [Humulus lupulus]|uniref:homeobox-DDT domain protein RLT2 isoform X2 n=1 Tax=Humulus lupulus TaxID=3486 RepID=UPI002B40826A|nr:homeobox-DDT domain protein RLT2 isoform X2 [Humulus lupulus]